MMDWEDKVGGESTTRASTASSLKLRRANARRPLTHSLTNPEHLADLMRFRVGSHWLSVVTGRWTDGGTVRAQRYCRKCMAYTLRMKSISCWNALPTRKSDRSLVSCWLALRAGP